MSLICFEQIKRFMHISDWKMMTKNKGLTGLIIELLSGSESSLHELESPLKLPLRRFAETWANGIGGVGMLTSAEFSSEVGKIFSGRAVSEILDT
ncbi:hypothetical protein RCL_jg7526.t1 [Rhizophagus clarus]|uniref:Uncharacterized protein n=1 Tax=Rhizophagus clarus TaxID=94130 RepID=A0A8H3KVZ8_9GLOM|nr:hypothetical protein RCL_jg7526.t1 [Rhizophagus clarus]